MLHKNGYSASLYAFAFALRTFYNDRIKCLGRSNSNELKYQIITDQMKQKLPLNRPEHFIHGPPNVQSIGVLENKLQCYEATRRKVKIINKNPNSFENEKTEITEPENYKTFINPQYHDDSKMKQSR